MRVHIVHNGQMSKLHTVVKTDRPIPLYTPKRSGVMSRSSNRNPMHNVCETFRVYGVNANPMKAGTTAGSGVVVSRRNTCAYTHTH